MRRAPWPVIARPNQVAGISSSSEEEPADWFQRSSQPASARGRRSSRANAWAATARGRVRPEQDLLAAADLAYRIRHADDVGLVPLSRWIDFAQVMDRVDRARRVTAPHDLADRLQRHRVEVVAGQARFLAPGIVEVAGRRLRCRKAIIATGSRPLLPPIPGLADLYPLTSDTVWGLAEQPRSLAILGGGAVGCELAVAFARPGLRVALIEAGERLLAREDRVQAP